MCFQSLKILRELVYEIPTALNFVRLFHDQQGQIKLKESALESSTNSFLEKERDLQDKIEELDRRLEDLSQNAERLSEQESHKVSYKPSIFSFCDKT